MKVLHIGLLSHFTDGMTYQDNILADINAKDGHDVLFITDTNAYLNGELQPVPEEDVILSDGVRLIRLKYDRVINNFITNHIQKVQALPDIIEKFQPDAIMYHGCCGYELIDVAKYIRNHPNITFYVDSHEDFYNTGRKFGGKLSYKIIHGRYIKKALPYVDKILYLSVETRDFLRKIYGLKDNYLEFYPLGGILQTEKHQRDCRKSILKKLNLGDDTIIFSHSGKLDKLKKTADILRAFSRVNNVRFVLIIFGKIPDEESEELKYLIDQDKRVYFLGWKQGDEIIDLLAGTDVYLQPGSQSATSQVAACCGCAEVVAPVSSYKFLYGDSVDYADNEQALYDYFVETSNNSDLIKRKKESCFNVAKEKLDYHKLAQRYLYKENKS